MPCHGTPPCHGTLRPAISPCGDPALTTRHRPHWDPALTAGTPPVYVSGGVILASVKELDFAWAALISACIANLFAAFKGNENKKLMETEGLKDRMGSVGNQVCCHVSPRSPPCGEPIPRC